MSGRHYVEAIPLICPNCGAQLDTARVHDDDPTMVSAACPNPLCPTVSVPAKLLTDDGIDQQQTTIKRTVGIPHVSETPEIEN